MFIKILIIGILAVISPGPDIFITMKNSLAYGVKAGIATTLGIISGNALHISFVILGFSWLAHAYPQALNIVRLAGACYLSWIAYKLLRYAGGGDEKNEALPTLQTIGFGKAYSIGFFTNVLNVKAMIFFMSIFSQFLAGDEPLHIRWLYGAEMIAISTSMFSIISFLASRDAFRKFYFRFAKTIDYVFAAALIFIAFRILFEVFL